MTSNPIALQMYTLRDDAMKDLAGTFKAVAEIGYQAVELVGVPGLKATELRAMLDANGLRTDGMHVGLDRLNGDLAGVVADLQTLGGAYVICPWLPPAMRGGADDYRRLAEQLNAFGKVCAEGGLRFAFHNHDFEFAKFGETTGMHIMLAETDPALVSFELDVYWAAYAGFDPVATITEFGSRAPLIHLKDLADDRFFAEVGHGTLDIPGILAAADAAGAEWFVVEQDSCRRPATESVTMSLNYLKSLGRA